MKTSMFDGGAEQAPVMAHILIEVEASVAEKAGAFADAELRRLFGEAVFWPGMPAIELDSLKAKHNSSTGKIFMPAQGKVFARVVAKLRHPADGSGPEDLGTAAKVIEAASSLLGARRALYGACGMARPGCHDGYESQWWSDGARAKMEAIALMAASGMSWVAAPTRR